MELLIYTLRTISNIPQGGAVFSARTLEQAQHASQLILSDLEHQYTASELARKVGTNVYTLKSAFQHLFGCSLFRFGEQTRMEYARQLLLEGTFNASEVALRVGYPDVQNFSNAFKQFFSIRPGDVRGKKR